MAFLRNLARAVGVLSPQSRPSMVRTLAYDELTFLRQVTKSQGLEIKHLKQVTAEEISQGVDREYGRLNRFHQWLTDGLKADNDKLSGWLDTERKNSSHYQQAATESNQENVALRAEIRGLEADLDRLEKGRMRDNDLRGKESKRAGDFYTREATHWERSHKSLEAKMRKELNDANNRRVYREMNIAREERDKYIQELETRIETLTQEAEESDRREGNLKRESSELQRKILARSRAVTDMAQEVRSLKTELNDTKKALDKQNTSQSQLQAANESLITEKEELENVMSELTADNERDEKTFKDRAAQLAAEISDQHVKASWDSAVKEGQRLRAEWHEDVQRVRTEWQLDVQRERTERQTDVQKVHNEWKAWAAAAEAEATSMINELKTQVRNETTRANDAVVLVSQLQDAGAQLQDALDTAKQAIQANQAVSQAAMRSNVADQKRMKDLVQEVIQLNQLLIELQNGDASDQWQDALGHILETNQTLKKVKSVVDRDGVTYPELQHIVMEATICEQNFDYIATFIDHQTWPHLHRHLRQAYYTMELVMEAIKGSRPGAVTPEDREKVVQLLTTDRMNNLPEKQKKDAVMQDEEEEL